MKNIFISLLLMLTLICCQSKQFKYKIHNPNYLEYDNSAIFYTDTVQWSNDTAYYTNSNGSIVIISIDSLKDCQIDTLK